ncbi:hypothetical protein [Hydrogenophaga sp.]|uniref:hypothetical protein n=1 Tax=Hydrogenophaga sp. TaxID=1904254 RepID=UPI0025B8D48C|nr:hypothetical protein [Hydrogenophaga sp.]
MIGRNDAKIVLSAVDQTRAAFESAKKGLGGVGSAALSVKGTLATLGLGAVATALVSNVKAAANYADEMSKLAQRAGVTTEAISGLAYAARLGDVDNQALAQGLRKLGIDANTGGKKLAELGIEIADAGGKAKTNDQLLFDLADVLAGMEDPAQRAAVAAKLLGEEVGPKLIPLLSGGSKGLREITAEAEKFGQVVSTEAGKAAEEFNDNLTRMGELAAGTARSLANQLLPAINEVLKSLLKLPEQASLAGLAGDVMSLSKELKALESRQGSPFNFAGNLDQEIAQAKTRLAEAKRLFNEADKNRPGAAVGGGRGFIVPELARPTPAPGKPPDPSPTRTPQTAAKKEAEDFQRFLRGFDEARYGYLARRNDELLKEKESQEADHLEFLKGFDDARFEYIAQRNEESLRAEEAANQKRLQDMADFKTGLGDDLKGALSAAFRDTKDPLRAFGDAIANVVFTRVSGSLASSLVDGLLGGGGGAGIAGSFISSLLSFDGGGYTGSGSRAGGMDGRGGFVAMLHPNETVVDHSKGQGASGQPVTVIQNFTVGDVASVAMVRQAVAGSEQRIAAGMGRSMRYGGALS